MIKVSKSIAAANIVRLIDQAFYTGVYVFETPEGGITDAQKDAALDAARSTKGLITPSALKQSLNDLGCKVLAGNGYYKNDCPWYQPAHNKLIIGFSGAVAADPLKFIEEGKMSMAVVLAASNSGVGSNYPGMTYGGDTVGTAFFFDVGEIDSESDLEFLELDVTSESAIAVNDISLTLGV